MWAGGRSALARPAGLREWGRLGVPPAPRGGPASGTLRLQRPGSRAGWSPTCAGLSHSSTATHSGELSSQPRLSTIGERLQQAGRNRTLNMHGTSRREACMTSDARTELTESASSLRRIGALGTLGRTHGPQAAPHSRGGGGGGAFSRPCPCRRGGPRPCPGPNVLPLAEPTGSSQPPRHVGAPGHRVRATQPHPSPSSPGAEQRRTEAHAWPHPGRPLAVPLKEGPTPADGCSSRFQPPANQGLSPANRPGPGSRLPAASARPGQAPPHTAGPAGPPQTLRKHRPRRLPAPCAGDTESRGRCAGTRTRGRPAG